MDWQPIETAPKDGTPVDLWHKRGFCVATFWDKNNKCWACTEDDSNFSHWIPIQNNNETDHLNYKFGKLNYFR